jgi:hypothetical protein
MLVIQAPIKFPLVVITILSYDFSIHINSAVRCKLFRPIGTIKIAYMTLSLLLFMTYLVLASANMGAVIQEVPDKCPNAES